MSDTADLERATSVDLKEQVHGRAQAVNEALDRRLEGGTPSYLYEAARHLPQAGGKRLRPVLLLLISEACGRSQNTIEDRMPAALSVELVHTLSLIHDDIIDNDAVRRGVSSVHTDWDPSTAIVAGDLLYAEAFEVLLDSRAPPETRVACTRALARTCRELCEGQALDMRLSGDTNATEQQYLTAVERKTGALFGGAARLGAILAEGSAPIVEEAGRFGRQLGIAFQLYDDLLDLTGSSVALGKPVGSDLREEKQTLVTIHARRAGVDLAAHEDDTVIEEIRSVGSFDYVRRKAERTVDEATEALEIFPPSQAKHVLAGLSEYVVDRAT